MMKALLFNIIPKAQAQFGAGIQSPFDDNAYTDVSTLTNNNGGSFSTLELIISNVLGLITVLGSIMFIGYFLLGAISWITSGGDTGKVTKARDQMLHGVIGLFILVMVYAIVGLIGTVLGIDSILNPKAVLEGLVPN